LSFKDKVKNRNNTLYSLLYRAYYFVKYLNFPAIKPVYNFLYAERKVRHAFFSWLSSFVYYVPMFKVKCQKYGKGMVIYDGIPELIGDINITIGDKVCMHGKTTVSSGKIHPVPTLSIGDNSHLGYSVSITLGKEIIIGKNVLIANNVYLNSYDSHPIDHIKRANNEPPEPRGSGYIHIQDYAWIGSNSIILKNTTIGKGAIVGAGSIVTKDVDPFTIVAGNPARVVRDYYRYLHYRRSRKRNSAVYKIP